MNTVEKGDKFELDFYQYLIGQQDAGEPVFGFYPAELCKIYRKKKYYCREREADVEFDVVIEVTGQNREAPHLRVIFECKNYTGSVPEDRVTDFSDKIGRIFKHGAKGVLVVSSQLQSGAEKVARNRHIGIIKYDKSGWEVKADRSGRSYASSELMKDEVFGLPSHQKPLKFAAFFEGSYLSSIGSLMQAIEKGPPSSSIAPKTAPFMLYDQIQLSVESLLRETEYCGDHVDLEKICCSLELELVSNNEDVRGPDGNLILGTADFEHRKIQINPHENDLRERFTLSHEIGHFYLKHDQYLRSETILENELFVDRDGGSHQLYSRLEYQANIFAAELLLPSPYFFTQVDRCRDKWGLVQRAHGYIFVDDQPCNYGPYNQMIAEISAHFHASKEAIEIKLKQSGLLNDQRKGLSRYPAYKGRRF